MFIWNRQMIEVYILFLNINCFWDIWMNEHILLFQIHISLFLLIRIYYQIFISIILLWKYVSIILHLQIVEIYIILLNFFIQFWWWIHKFLVSNSEIEQSFLIITFYGIFIDLGAWRSPVWIHLSLETVLNLLRFSRHADFRFVYKT